MATPSADGPALEHRLYAWLLIALIGSVAIQGGVPAGAVQRIVVNILLGASLLLAFRVAQASRAMFVVAGLLAAVGVAVAVLRATGEAIGEAEVRLMSGLLVVLGPPAVATGVMRTLRRSGQVQVEAVMGVLAMYMLLGLLFAAIYGAIDRLGGDPFFASAAPATTSNCLYFSFTTLTTVGYGDFTARSATGHTIALFEALIGQIYLVTVVSVIVGNLKRRTPPDG